MASSLTQPAFWVLTALANQRRHGYEIMRDATVASGGRVSLKVTTLYAVLERLEREGLVTADGEEIVSGRARRYYRITEEGSVRLADEVVALEQLIQVARARLATHRFAFIAQKVVPT
ncbi:PadR family transcriptional regulator [Luethyella okanaganae]|uniref:PadR family transcriptional regulator n=1 Tax=Luethyella okanaganae TaxID=69372 RepID=A0ABW1VK48_9MICO